MKDNQNQVLQVATMEGYRDYSHMYDALGGCINLKVHFIGSPLQAAAANGHKKLAELLIANGVDVKSDITGHTALHSAAVNGQKELVELLIANGAEVDAKGDGGETPLFVAVSMCMERRSRQIKGNSLRDVLAILIKRGANVNAKGPGGRVPFHYAAAFADKETVELLIAAGADINARDKDGDTPLNFACRYRSKLWGGVIDLIHKHGAVRRHGKDNSYDYEPDLIGFHL